MQRLPFAVRHVRQITATTSMVVRQKDTVTMIGHSRTFEQAMLPMWNGCVMPSGPPWGKLIIL